MKRLSPVISGIGMVSAVGRTAATSCAAIRARISRFRSMDDYYYALRDDPDEKPTPLVMAPVLDDRADDRVETLLLDALRDLVCESGIRRTALASLPLFVCLPPWTMQGQSKDAKARLVQRLATRAGLPTWREAVIVDGGHTVMLEALTKAADAVASRQVGGAVVLGAGSYFKPTLLQALDASRRVKSERNSDGFVPGECGVALLLEAQAELERRGGNPLALICGWGLGRETGSQSSGEASSGRGLAQAIEQAFVAAGDTGGAQWTVCDLNGESYRAREWGLARCFLSSRLSGLRSVWHPADCLGDVGTAVGGALLASVTRAFVRGYSPTARALVWAGSEEGQRSAVIIDNLASKRS